LDSAADGNDAGTNDDIPDFPTEFMDEPDSLAVDSDNIPDFPPALVVINSQEEEPAHAAEACTTELPPVPAWVMAAMKDLPQRQVLDLGVAPQPCQERAG
jgi:hypothetical protein